MSKLNIDQKNIYGLFSDKKSDFLIPDYQRPYAWGEEQCLTLWDDIFNFAFPGDDCSKFDENEEYFLGSIVTFLNEKKQKEVIDGQQRLTTMLLLLRAFYDKFRNMKDKNSENVRGMISKCIWKTDEFSNANYDELKIDSEVATDDDKTEFLDILKTGDADKTKKSKYAENFRFFQRKIDKFLSDYPSYFQFLPARILNNCILLPIEAESQETALRIFSTLNDRGLPLSDADIFKSQFYKFYKDMGKKDDFIDEWKKLELLTEDIFHPIIGTPMDELFTRYMYYERAKQGIRSSTTEALRKFYEKNKYALLHSEKTFENLKILADFWKNVERQNANYFSQDVLKKLFVLNYAPNGMWCYLVSVYFMQNKDSENKLDNDKFAEFLSKIIGFVWAYAMTNPGVNALRTPVFAEMINIVNGEFKDFADFKISTDKLQKIFEHYDFTNNRTITRSMLTWWAMQHSEQTLPALTTTFHIEHIISRRRQENDNILTDVRGIDSLGNKSLLEDDINIRASDYKFQDKVRFYRGQTGKQKIQTIIKDLLDVADSHTDFNESDMNTRNQQIISAFIKFLSDNNLTQE